MARPIAPRAHYTTEIRHLATLRAVVAADRMRGEAWINEAQRRIDTLIRHLTEPPATAPERGRAA